MAMLSKKVISMTRKKPVFARSLLMAACLAVSLVGWSSPAFSADEDENTITYDYEQRAAELAMQAMSVIDAQYKYGGNAPETGIDCSGLVRYVYKKAWDAELPQTAAAISEVGESIETAELQPGDLVFYNTQKRQFSHVGIYLGDNKFVHAPSRGGKVRVESMDGRYWQVRFDGARRITDPQKEKMETEQMIQAFRDDARSKTLVRSR
jgi:cell wall-associated NlpC family hydrolase